MKVIHAESEKDLCARDFAEAQRIGIVAGASTPWSIERVEKWLRLHRFASAPRRARLFRSVLRLRETRQSPPGEKSVLTGPRGAILYRKACDNPMEVRW